MRQNAEMRKPFWESLLKVLSTRGWEVNILPCSVVINATLNCSPSFICDTLRNAVKNWGKTNGKQTKNFTKEMWHRLHEVSVFYWKSGIPVCPVQATHEPIFCPSAFTQRSREELSSSCCPVLPSGENRRWTHPVAAVTPKSGNSLLFLTWAQLGKLLSRKENK